MNEFLKAFDQWRHPHPEEATEEKLVVGETLSGVRSQLDAVLRETKELDVQLAMAEIRLKSRGWAPINPVDRERPT